MKTKITLVASTLLFAVGANANNFYNTDNVKETQLLEQAAITPYIIGGIDSNMADFPYYARLVATDFSTTATDFCGGSILNDQYILTAAHCVTYEGTTDPYVDEIKLMGVITNNGSMEYVIHEDTHKVSEIIVHPDYNVSNFANDIALVKLETAMTAGDFTAITLPTDDDVKAYTAKETVTVMGLGYTDDNKTTPTIIQQADVKNVSDSECLTLVDSIYQVSYNAAKQTCVLPGENASQQPTAVCNGDSGGPLTFKNDNDKYQQYGITSYGSAESCFAAGHPQVFTEIYGYKDWINCKANEDCKADTDFEGNFEDGGSSGGSTGLFTLFGLGLLGLRRRK